MKKIEYKNIPNCLRKYRKSRGLKQKEAAKMLGLKSASMISRWEKGICLPNPLNVFKLAILYQTMADALFIDLIRLLRKELFKKKKEVLETKKWLRKP